MTISQEIPLLRINAPEFYTNPDFLVWLNAPSTATWHKKGEPPNEYSDAFFTVNGDDGSDAPCAILALYPAIPDGIWKQITEAAAARDLDECLVWVSNLQE
jgi:hypothetical protein